MNVQFDKEIIGLGHNRAPLKELLTESYADLFRDIEENLGYAERAPKVIEDDATSGLIADLVGDLRKLRKQVESAHDAEKKPFLDAGRIVDDFTRTPTAELDAAIKALLAVQTPYLQKKEEAARAEAKRLADEAAAEAAEKLRLAERAQDNGDFDTASDALNEAVKAEEAAASATATLEAKPADLTRIYSRGGSVTSLRKEWTFEVTDRAALDLNALRPYLAPADLDKAIRGFVKAGGRSLAGTRIFEQAKAR